MLAAIAAVVAGAPVNDAPLEKRDNSGLEVCTDVGFKGRCIHLVNPFNDCSMFSLTCHPGDSLTHMFSKSTLMVISMTKPAPLGLIAVVVAPFSGQ